MRWCDFWHKNFAQLPPKRSTHEIESTLPVLAPSPARYIQHIVGQSQTRLDFTKIMDTGKIVFVKLSSNLSA